MSSRSSTKALESVLNFIKGGNLQPGSKPGFAHGLNLSYNQIAKERLSLSDNRKVLTYRYSLNDHQVPKATAGLFSALMDECSTNAIFASGMPSPPGVSLQMQTELLQPLDNVQEFDIINIVTKLGRTISHTRTDFVCTKTQQTLAFSSHVKYMPIGNIVMDWVFTKPWLFKCFETWFIQRKGNPQVYDDKHLYNDVIAGHMEPVNVGRAHFHITREHTNPFGAMHGGCHAMVMEHVGTAFAQAELSATTSAVTLEAMQIDYLAAAKGSVDVVCESIGTILDSSSRPTIIHVRVKIQKGDRILSEGKLSLLKFWHADSSERKAPDHDDVCNVIASVGSISVLQWAHEQGFPWDDIICMFAAEGGHLETLKWLHKNGCEWDECTCFGAAIYGHLETLKWAHENGCPSWDAETCSAAAGEGHFEVLKWLHENGAPWDEDTCFAAADRGQFEILKWAHENGCPWDSRVCLEAARKGHFEVLKWLHENGAPWDEETCTAACGNGHFEILKLLHENGCPWDAFSCSGAAYCGHFGMLKWAHQNGCPWDEHTCNNAASDGNLEMLQWAHENGCPWDEDTCWAAAGEGHLETLKWLRENGCPWDGDTLTAASDGGHLECLKWARENGCPE
ncbi:ankyrin containing protein (ISS) [Seminavis robusta]|uniref:Ankyrin containing protein (ISS) n=1 Tax=Seminavis robusta TaxID=568900 RepID=A0A9N8D8V2_9STRA|nr:ankyrin containing protein (ISS) [Seminavis robusta]|eukprot:Sro18_g012820.1 ankyrin containing protein (ISS) (623) ;mRNA; r:71261-73439